MATKLTIDEGNSSTKMAVWHDDVMDRVVTSSTMEPQILSSLLAEEDTVDAAIVCSVRGRREDGVRSLLGRYTSDVTLLSASTPLPVSIEYASASTLGADRIAAAVGASVIAPGCSCLIVDIGTAITYDVLTADGRYLGGNIAPGIFMRLEALHHFTSALPAVETDGDVPAWGYDTETALRAGAIRGVVAEVKYYRHRIARRRNPRTILTGGSAHLITHYIAQPVTIEPNLVLIGLNHIISSTLLHQ